MVLQYICVCVYIYLRFEMTSFEKIKSNESEMKDCHISEII